MAKRRLFIDPGSISAGWALFSGSTLISSGTCASLQKDKGDADAFRRLSLIMGHYGALANEIVDEVHIEQLVRNTHQYTHWAVGAIGSLLAASGATVTADVAISSWQKFCGWKKLKSDAKALDDVRVSHMALKRLQKAREVSSLDQLAAIGMGLYWTGR